MIGSTVPRSRVSAGVAIVNVAEVAPAGMVTVAGIVASVGSLVVRVTVSGLVGAAAFSIVTVPVVADPWPCVTTALAKLTLRSGPLALTTLSVADRRALGQRRAVGSWK